MVSKLIVTPNGTQKWLCDGILHKDHGPARIYWNGDEEWFCNGTLHRIDGPARNWKSGHQEWWINGKRLLSHEVNEWLQINNYSIPLSKEAQTELLLRWG